MKRMLPRALLIALLTIACITLHAQHAEDAILQQLNQKETQKSPDGVTLNQDGLNNEAYILQVTETTSGAEAVQVGNENRIHLIQTGNYIDIRVTQDGTGNLYEADIEGEDSKIDISQSGTENSIFQSLMLMNTGISIMQQGERNEVIHTGTSSNSGIQVQQQGTGMKVIIQTN